LMIRYGFCGASLTLYLGLQVFQRYEDIYLLHCRLHSRLLPHTVRHLLNHPQTFALPLQPLPFPPLYTSQVQRAKARIVTQLIGDLLGVLLTT
jgi:hypothetical protein